MNGEVKEFVKTFIGNQNLFVMFQIAWLIEFYALAIFSGGTFIDRISHGQIKELELVNEYSAKISDWMVKYETYIYYYAIILLIAGFSGFFIKHIFVLRNYQLILGYADFGLYAGAWLLFIFITYRAYILLNAWFLIIPILVSGGCFVLKKLRYKVTGKSEFD